MGERWVACCHQKFHIWKADDEAGAVTISLGAILLSLLSTGDTWHYPQTFFVTAPRAESDAGTQWEQARAASECSPTHRAAPKQRITWPAMLMALILKSPQVNAKQPTMIPRLPITSSFFSQELFQENLALKLIFCCYCNKWPWPTWLKWYRFHYLVPLKVRSLPSVGDDKESVACHSRLLQASHCFWFVALTS